MFLIRAIAFKSDLLRSKRTKKPGRETTCPYMFADGRFASKKNGCYIRASDRDTITPECTIFAILLERFFPPTEFFENWYIYASD